MLTKRLRLRNIWTAPNLCVCLRSIKLTSIAGLTGLHNCDQAEVERHAAEVISHLTRLCLEAGDQVTTNQNNASGHVTP